jgi:flagellar hook-associated protein 3 FlgL
MRVTQNLFADSLISRLNMLTARQYGLQSQVSSGLRVQAPSDDPTAMENVLGYQTSQAAQTQYGTNVSTLQQRADSIYNVLQSLQTVSNRMGEISTLANDPTKSTSDLNTYAAEVSQLIQHAADLVNSKDASTGQYLFGGTSSGQAPFTVTKDANGNVTGVTYQGNTSVAQSEIAPGATLSVDVPGQNNSGSGPHGLVSDSRSGADLFNHLISLQNNLLAGNKAAIISTDVPALQKDENNILYQISNNGAVQTRLNSAATLAGDTSSSLDQMISKASNADIVQTMVQLNEAQNAYQAALQSGAKIMQLSLLNYIPV